MTPPSDPRESAGGSASLGRRRAIQLKLTDVVGVRAFWQWYDRLPEPQRAQHIAPLLNKLRAFVLRGPVRAIIGQTQSRVDIGGFLDSGGLLLVRIPKGTVGEETSRLLGAPTVGLQRSLLLGSSSIAVV